MKRKKWRIKLSHKERYRKLIYNKTHGHCAYCGCQLKKCWHIDEIKPVNRIFTYNERKHKNVWTGKYEHPENLNIDNQIAACPSCNINKHGMSIESFREFIQNFIISLNRDSTQYKIAKRFKLVEETNKKVIFYFEGLTNENNT
jgi:hypothetical protein